MPKRVSLKIKNASLVAIFEVLSQKLQISFLEVKPGIFHFSKFPRVSMEFSNADLSVILDLLSRQAGANILISSEVHGRVNLNFRNVAWRDALEATVAVCGYKLKKSKKGILSVVKR